MRNLDDPNLCTSCGYTWYGPPVCPDCYEVNVIRGATEMYYDFSEFDRNFRGNINASLAREIEFKYNAEHKANKCPGCKKRMRFVMLAKFSNNASCASLIDNECVQCGVTYNFATMDRVRSRSEIAAMESVKRRRYKLYHAVKKACPRNNRMIAKEQQVINEALCNEFGVHDVNALTKDQLERAIAMVTVTWAHNVLASKGDLPDDETATSR